MLTKLRKVVSIAALLLTVALWSCASSSQLLLCFVVSLSAFLVGLQASALRIQPLLSIPLGLRTAAYETIHCRPVCPVVVRTAARDTVRSGRLENA